MVSFFKEKSSLAVFGTVLVSICLHAHFLIQPPVISTKENDGLLYYLLFHFTQMPSLAAAVLYHVIVIVQALRINYLLNDARMFQRPVFTAALAYILLTALLPQWNNITVALMANSMIIWLFFRITKLYNAQQPKALLYNIGLITASTVLLCYAAIPLLLLIFFALGVLRPFRINEWLVLLLGIVTPFYFFAGYLFLNNQFNTISKLINLFQPHSVHPQNIISIIITFCTAGAIILSGAYFWQNFSNRMVVQVRKNWSILFLMMLLLIPPVFFLKDAWPLALLLVVVPASAFVSNAFLYPEKNIVATIFFWLLVAVCVYNNWWVTK